MNSELIEELSDNVKNSKDMFIAEINRLNYVVKLMNESPEIYTDSSLISAVRGVVKSHEDYINSKIVFTEKYFEEKLK